MKNEAVGLALAELKKAIRGIKAGVTKSWELMETEYEEAKKELQETRAVKDEILAEVSRFKTLLEDQEKGIKEKEDENRGLAAECEQLRQTMQTERDGRMAGEKEDEATMRELCDGLSNVISKYEGVDFVTSRVALKPNVDFDQDRVLTRQKNREDRKRRRWSWCRSWGT